MSLKRCAMRLHHRRGMTLVELMIVVAIVGILAAVGGTALFRQIKRAKIAKLENIAAMISKGQEEFRSNHGSYYPPPPDGGNTTDVIDRNLSDPAKKRLSNLIGYNPNDLDPGVLVNLYAGDAGAGCNAPSAGVCGVLGANPPAWYIVTVEQDLDGKGAPNTTVVRSSTTPNVVILNEGQ